MSTLVCPHCQSPYVYEQEDLYICPECGQEWPITPTENITGIEVRDAYNTLLHDGDSVSLIKDLKLKGSSNTLKVGTRIKNIHLVEGDHNISCKLPQIGNLYLKSEFVKKI